jgi:hypothetical protein
MIERDPISDRLLRGEIYRYRAPRRPARREPDPEVLEVVRRAQEKLLREYLERRRRAS